MGTNVTFSQGQGQANPANYTTDAVIGYGVGIYAEYKLGRYISFQPEVHYMFINNEQNSQFLPQAEVRYQSIQVPVLLRVNFPLRERTAIYALGGGFGGFPQKAEARVGDVAENIKNELETFHYGAIAGAGLQAGLFCFELRYHFGISNILVEDDEIGPSGRFEAKQNGIYATMGISF